MTAGVAIIAVAVMAGAAAAERSRLAGSLTVLARLHWTLLPVGILLEATVDGRVRRDVPPAAHPRSRPAHPNFGARHDLRGQRDVGFRSAGRPGLAAAYLFRRFTRLGAGALLAGWALLAGGVISAVAWVLLLVGGGLASGRTLALVIAVPCVALAVIVAALIWSPRGGRGCGARWRGTWRRRSSSARACCGGRPPIRCWLCGPGPNGSARSASPRQPGSSPPGTRWSTGSPTRPCWP